MKILHNNDYLQLVAKGAKKWVLYLSYHADVNEVEVTAETRDQWSAAYDADLAQLRKDITWLDDLPADGAPGWKVVASEIIMEGGLIVLCDTEDELMRLYGGTNGDDTGGKVYALSVNPKGQFMNENT